MEQTSASSPSPTATNSSVLTRLWQDVLHLLGSCVKNAFGIHSPYTCPWACTHRSLSSHPFQKDLRSLTPYLATSLSQSRTEPLNPSLTRIKAKAMACNFCKPWVSSLPYHDTPKPQINPHFLGSPGHRCQKLPLPLQSQAHLSLPPITESRVGAISLSGLLHPQSLLSSRSDSPYLGFPTLRLQPLPPWRAPLPLNSG